MQIDGRKPYQYDHEMGESPNQRVDDEDEGGMNEMGEDNKQEEDEDPIQEKIAKIIQICKENDALFGDSEFPANDQSLYTDPTDLPDYA